MKKCYALKSWMSSPEGWRLLLEHESPSRPSKLHFWNIIFCRVSDPDPYSESGSGSRRTKMTHKRRKNSCFEVLDGL
jgi:hypothetical protein